MSVRIQTLKIVSELLIDDTEAEVLHLLTSYDLAEWFTTRCNKTEKTPEQIKKVLQEVRRQTSLILDAKREAYKAVGKVAEE